MATRDPKATREHILQSAFRAVYERGMSAASLDQVLARAGVTKGALYHHFVGKKELACAVVEEVIAPLVHATWVDPLLPTNDPISTLQSMLQRQAATRSEDVLRHGCPLNKLAQEVSSFDEELRSLIEGIFARWAMALREALARGQGAGAVRGDINPERVALFVVGAIEGAISLARVDRDADTLRGNLEELAAYLEALRPANRTRKKR